MDTSPYTNLLRSLSRMTPLSIEIWTGSEPVFRSDPQPASTPPPDSVKAFSSAIQADPRFHAVNPNPGVWMYGVPLATEEKVEGILIAHGPNGAGKTKPVETFLTEIARLIQSHWSYQKESEQLTQELTQSFEELHLYSQLAKQIKDLRFPGERFKHLLEQMLETMRVDLAFSRLDQRDEYTACVHRPELLNRTADPEGFTAALLHALAQSPPTEEETYRIVDDSRKYAGYRGIHPEPFRFLAVKVEHHQKVYGWVGLVAFNVDEIFRRSELSLLGSIAEQAAMVIANTDLYRDLERFVINVVKSLVYAIEAKDYYTSGHSERVNRYCMRMANHLELDKKAKENLHWASILHDVGKIGIPEIILNKPEGLDTEEYALIKNHPQKGYDILKPIEQLAGSLPGIRHHHERYDGTGYPDGLKGDAIPLIARIIAIADTFDAVTSDRAYRSGIGTRAAFALMEKGRGTQFDPDLLRVFRKAYSQEHALLRKDSDGHKNH